MSATPRTVQETVTDLSPDEVLAQAKTFFATRPKLYAAFLDKEGPGWCSFRGQGGEEIVVAVRSGEDGKTHVTGSTYLYEMQLARFFTTITPVGAA